MSQSPPKLEPSIRKHLSPVLRAEGFRGGGRTFRRIEHDAVHLVNIQGFYYGGRFAVNLAVQPLCLPDMVGNPVQPSKITENLCEFRTRLTESGPGRSWDHDGTSEGIEAAVLDATDVYRAHAHRFFQLFCGNNSVLRYYDIESLKSDNPDLAQYCLGSKARVAFVMARLRLAQGRIAEAKVFALFALAEATSTFVGYQQLQEIANAA